MLRRWFGKGGVAGLSLTGMPGADGRGSRLRGAGRIQF